MIIIGLVASCGAAPAAVQDSIGRTALSPADAAKHKQHLADGDAKWADRLEQASLEAALANWEAATKIKDNDWDTYAKLTRGYYFLADAHFQFEAMGGGYPYNADGVKNEVANGKYLNAHLRGLEHARRGMAALSNEFEQRMKAGTRIEDAIKVIGPEGIPLVYWYASNLGKWSKAKGITTVLKHKDSIFKVVSHVYETAPNYFHGAADRYFGAFFAVAPAFAGGDLNRSKDHFTASLKTDPNYIGTYVLAAELYATKNRSPDVFDAYLATVMKTPENIIPELTPEATIEKKKAEFLIKNRDDLF